MTTTRRDLLIGFALAPAFAGLPRAALAAYPERPIHLIVPFAPGGNADVVGRVVAEQISYAVFCLKKKKNHGGAGGSIGAEQVARATPDGYTLLVGSNGPLTVNPFVQARLGYDPLKDFAPIALTSYVRTPSWSIRACRRRRSRNSSPCRKPRRSISRRAASAAPRI